ncbi:hypothetical protein F4777DRAFT_546225 [Nemania sp. FL0916]|nr:hypothetical protein F4777DRAFT_546225 [Nemania sp. FL0916]
MVSLEAIRESNARVATDLPPGLVAVFVGATSGIGEAALRHVVEQAVRPRIYFLGRREIEGKRIEAELKTLNPKGEYHYLKCDASLLKNIDTACRYIKEREQAINLLFLTSGTLLSTLETEEGLHYPAALMYYGRTRFIVNLLPQLRQAPALRRVVTVAAGGKEGLISTNDFQARNINILSFRGHMTSMITLSLESLAKQAPEVSFIHTYPGFVKTNLARELTGVLSVIVKVVTAPLMALFHIPIEETGERHTFFATSACFPPRDSERRDADGISLGNGVVIAAGADGKTGSGVYSIDYAAEGTAERVQKIIKDYMQDGTAEKVWAHTEEEYMRITGSLAV